MQLRLFIILSTILFCNNVFCQNDSVVIKVNQIRFKTKKLQDLVAENIAEFKTLFKANPKIVTLDFFERMEKRKNDEGELSEIKNIILKIELNINKYTTKSDWKMLDDNFIGGTTFEDTIILVRAYDKVKFKDELFFFVDSKKNTITLELGGNMTFLNKTYSYNDNSFILLESQNMSDLYKN